MGVLIGNDVLLSLSLTLLFSYKLQELIVGVNKVECHDQRAVLHRKSSSNPIGSKSTSHDDRYEVTEVNLSAEYHTMHSPEVSAATRDRHSGSSRKRSELTDIQEAL